jgi:hypothetical protein
MYMSSFEAFLQEMLAISRTKSEGSAQPDTARIIGMIDELKNEREFKKSTINTFRIFNRNNVTIRPSSAEFQNLFALEELRNAVIHYNPEFIEYAYWPVRLEHALQRTKIEVLNAGWVTNFSRPEIADWARETVKTAIGLFCDVSGCENPFTTTACDGQFRWE